MSLCLTAQCDTTQEKSGYTVFSEEGSVDPKNIPPPGMPGAKGASTKLFFSWSEKNKDNWVTNSSSQPGPSYGNCGNSDGFLYTTAAKGRNEMFSFANANNTHHLAASSPKVKQWAKTNGYTVTGSLGYLDAPAPVLDLCTAHSGTDYVCCDLKQVHNTGG
jgi:hypothetical protein